RDAACAAVPPPSLHDALPIWSPSRSGGEVTFTSPQRREGARRGSASAASASLHRRCTCHEPLLLVIPANAGIHTYRVPACAGTRSEEHTSELQSRENLVCRLL